MIYDVCFLLGHNNDQGAFLISGMKEMVEREKIFLLTDGGYSHHRLISPDKCKCSNWKNTQQSLRSVVETVIGLVKTYGVAGGVFRGSPELHELALMTVYQITNMMLKVYPLRIKI